MNHNDEKTEHPVILIAEDDPDDRLLIEQAFQAAGLSENLFFVYDGEELMDFLLGREQYSVKGPSRPACLLLDLKMPRMDGREALSEIRKNPEYTSLPVLVLSTSDSENDKEYCTRLGVCDYITKPDSFDGLLTVVKKSRKICFPF